MSRLARRGSMRSLVASVGAAVATVAMGAVLLWFVLTGRMTPGGAAPAAVAIVQLGGTLTSLAFCASQLSEGSLFLEDHRARAPSTPVAATARSACRLRRRPESRAG